jgi:hypothetical protein
MTKRKKTPLSDTPTGIEQFIFFIGIIFLIAGVITCFMTWPEYEGGLGYIFPIMSAFSGVVSFAIFLAISKILENQRKLLWLLSSDENYEELFYPPKPVDYNAKATPTQTDKFGEDFPQQ